MTKLKTLKDITYGVGKPEIIYYQDLRQEVIKVIKSFNDVKKTLINDRLLIPLVNYDASTSKSLVFSESKEYLSITKETIDFIKWFLI